MSKMLSAQDAVGFAVELEARGVHFYREAAKRMENEEQRNLVLLLMSQSNHHLEGVKKIFAYVQQLGEDEVLLDQGTAAYITALGSSIGFPSEAQAAQKVADCSTVAQILDIALQGEKDSLTLYREIADKTTDSHVRMIFRALQEEEATHVRKLGEMMAGWA